MPQDQPISPARAAFTSDYLWKRFLETYHPTYVRGAAKDGLMRRDVQPGVDLAFPIDLDLLAAALSTEAPGVIPPPPPDDGDDGSSSSSSDGSDSASDSASDSGSSSDSGSGSDSGSAGSGGESDSGGNGDSDSGTGSGDGSSSDSSSSSADDGGPGDDPCFECGGPSSLACLDNQGNHIDCPATHNGSPLCGCAAVTCRDLWGGDTLPPDFCDDCFGSYCDNMSAYPIQCPKSQKTCCYVGGATVVTFAECCACH